MTDPTPVAVTSRSFSRHPVLRAELLARYSDVAFNDEGISLAGSELVRFLAGRRKAIVALERLDEGVLAELPELELISKVGVGVDMLDFDALERHGVRVSLAPGTNSRSVAELALALVLATLRKVIPAAVSLQAGEWRQEKGGCLSGRTVGIVGFGHVGRDVARLLRGFDCQLLAHDPLVDVESFAELSVLPRGLDDLLREADVVSLHVALTEQTRDLIDARRLGLMKPDAVLVNTARGGLVDEQALAERLKGGLLAGAAFDAFAVEPPIDSELLSLPNFVGTPHIGGSTEEAILAMGRAAIDGLDA